MSKRRLLPLLLLLVLPFTIPAADDDKPKPKPPLPKLWSKIGLTDTQRAETYRVRTLFGDQIAKLEEQINALKAEERNELNKILTAEQKKKLAELLLGEKP